MTLIELLVVVAIVGILATAAYSVTKSARRNVYLRQAAGELVLNAVGLRSTALAEGRTHLLVVVDAAGNDASACGWSNPSGCASWYVLALSAAQATAWQLASFDPAHPETGATVMDQDRLPRGARFLLATAYAAPPKPFDGLPIFDSRVLGTCASGARCFALRFSPDGVASAVAAGGAAPTAAGFAFVLATDRELDAAGGDRRGVVVGFPSGAVKTWGY